MTGKPVLGADKSKASSGRKRDTRGDTVDRVLAFIRWTGLCFFFLGAIDVGLTWLPTDFGNREWEFATVTASYNGMPVILLGLTLVTVAATIEMQRWWALVSGVAALVFLIFALGATALWATNIPLALEAVEGVVLTGMKKAIFKTAAQSVVLPLVFGLVSYHGFKTFRGQKT